VTRLLRSINEKNEKGVSGKPKIDSSGGRPKWAKGKIPARHHSRREARWFEILKKAVRVQFGNFSGKDSNGSTIMGGLPTPEVRKKQGPENLLGDLQNRTGCRTPSTASSTSRACVPKRGGLKGG